MQVMIHDDDCGEYLDKDGKCPKCLFHPDCQSTAFVDVEYADIKTYLKQGNTMLGLYRKPISVKMS
jgi:hypothetical protein